MTSELNTYKAELEAELRNILDYWMAYTVDHEQGGFYGRIDKDNTVSPDAPKGSVLNARILWSFSAAYNHTGREDYYRMAERAYLYLTGYFMDPEYGGVYWTVDPAGQPWTQKSRSMPFPLPFMG